ncbi:hypothetical protein D0Y65_001080 [Glycine soja]|uniref:Uncharacterized protein n=1 Tax=Glycine soja TaxID=3848 RepID=A0A445M1H7_GLYSO|nr:hypothetical protein D0Y65_001080 [Glycine soja]
MQLLKDTYKGGVELGDEGVNRVLKVRDPHAVHHHLTDGVAGRDEKGGRRQDISSKRDDADVNGWRICPELGGGWWVAHQAPSSNPPSQSPSSGQRPRTSEPSIGRKLGMHRHNQIRSSDTKSPTPSEAPQSEKKMHSISEGSIPSHQRTSIEPHDGEVLGSHHGQVHLSKQRHHSFDKSRAGAGVILVGLATTFLVSVFCYIRATRRNKLETTA